MHGLKHVRPGNGFVPNFPLTQKVDVNGEKEHAMYTYMKAQCPHVWRQVYEPVLYKPIYTEDVRWNYEKFLIGPDGKPIYRYAHTVEPATDAQLKADIMAELTKMKSGGSPSLGDIIGIPWNIG